jgi:protease-4
MKRPGGSPLLLEIDLTRPIVDAEPDDLPGRLRARGAVRWRRLVRSVHDAATARDVAGLVAVVAPGLTLAQAQELAGAVAAVRAAGKPTVAWADTFGEAGNAAPAYLLATAFADVWLQPSGTLGLAGVAAEVMFLRGGLDKLGITPQLGQRHEYKSAADRIVREQFTAPHEQMMQRLTDSAWEQIVAAVAAGRGLAEPDAERLLEAGPWLADDALAAGLVDRLGDRDQAYQAARAACGEHAMLRYADQWLPRPRAARRVVRAVSRPQAVAVVDVAGTIAEGRSRRTLTGRSTGSVDVAAELRAAAADDRIGAVVLRVDSPGGSAVASDTIWHAVRRVSGRGKPVVACMGSVAASGGYYVSCPADVIVAQPTTLTGSIGVVGGKFVTRDLLARLGVSIGSVERGARARMFSTDRPFTDDEWARADQSLDAVYADFVGKVARGRGMPVDAVDAVARGRVWTGADAAGHGLVDVLGGLPDALAIARDRAGLPADAPVRRVAATGPLAGLRPPRSSEHPRAAAPIGRAGGWTGSAVGDAVAAIAASLAPALGGAAVLTGAPPDLRLGPRPGDLVMLPIRLTA